MNYDDFRQVWDDALRASGMKANALFPQETIDLGSLERSYQVFIHHHFSFDHRQIFYVTVEMSWRWDALLSARFATTEEDLLTELLGPTRRSRRTERPYLRVDSILHATVPMDGFYPAPSGSAWRDWAAEVAATVAPIIPSIMDDDPDSLAALSWCGEPEVKLSCSPGGQLYLQGVSLPAFRVIRLPRQWDDPQRRRDPHPVKELVEYFRQVQAALQAWENALARLTKG